MHRLAVVCLLLLLLAACAPPNDPAPPITPVAATLAAEPTAAATPGVSSGDTPAPEVSKPSPLPEGAVIAFERTGGFVGAMDRWVIYPDGTVEHTARAEAPVTTAGALPADQVAQLTADLEALGFFTFADSYGANVVCNDCYYYGLTVSAGGQTKSVSTHDAAEDTPPEVWEAIERVERVVEGVP
jgi:hypothetical protein